MKELKEVKIKDGKFTLEGKVVEAEPIELKAIMCIGVHKDSDSLDFLKSDIVKGAKKKADAYVIGKMDNNHYHQPIQSCYPVLYLKIKE